MYITSLNAVFPCHLLFEVTIFSPLPYLDFKNYRGLKIMKKAGCHEQLSVNLLKTLLMHASLVMS